MWQREIVLNCYRINYTREISQMFYHVFSGFGNEGRKGKVFKVYNALTPHSPTAHRFDILADVFSSSSRPSRIRFPNLFSRSIVQRAHLSYNPREMCPRWPRYQTRLEGQSATSNSSIALGK
jgi:hypothetical protein